MWTIIKSIADSRILRGPRRVQRALRVAADAEAYTIQRLVRDAAAATPAGARMLDVGAGARPYERFFPHVQYESCDYSNKGKVPHDYLCDVQEMPMPDNTFDALLCTQVLDDVPNPQRAINEFFRILKPGGSLFLTAPMSGRIHSEPYHFFHFTNFGLDLLFRNAGFVVEYIQPRGGYFLYLSYMMRKLPIYFLNQYRAPHRESSGAVLRGVIFLRNGLLQVIYFLVLPVFRYLIPWLLFVLDRVDRDRAFTLGYRCHCRKPAAGS